MTVFGTSDCFDYAARLQDMTIAYQLHRISIRTPVTAKVLERLFADAGASKQRLRARSPEQPSRPLPVMGR